MKRPFRETNESKIDANYTEFMRRMYAEEAEEAEIKHFGIVSLTLFFWIPAFIGFIIFQLS
jgi:hypothetical protein